MEALPENINHAIASLTVRYTLAATSSDSAKLQTLVNIMYDKELAAADCVAALLLRLVKLVTDVIKGTPSQHHHRSTKQAASRKSSSNMFLQP